MNTNNTQVGHISLGSLLQHNDDQSNIDQILSNEIVITSQPLITFTTTNMIPSLSFRIQNNVPEDNHLTQTQLFRPIRRPRQRQQRREQRQEERERQQQEAQRPRQQQSEQQQSRPRYRRWSEIEREHKYLQSVGFEYYIEENMSLLLEAYEWGKMDPKERQDRWEQENLKELERITSFEQQAHLTLVQDEIEQLQNIETAQTIREEEEKRERNNQQLIDLKQSERIQFLLQQMAQSLTYHC